MYENSILFKKLFEIESITLEKLISSPNNFDLAIYY